MKKILFSILVSLLTACGTQGKSSSSLYAPDSAPVPVDTSLTTTTSKMSQPLYIVSGQSNAAGLLNALNGIDSHTQNAFINTPVGNFVGTGISGSSILYWLDSNNTGYLYSVINTYCSQNPYFIWYQGESDTFLSDQGEFEGSYLDYNQRLTTFLNTVANMCPTMKIELVRIRQFSAPTQDYVSNIRQIQMGTIYPWIDVDDLPVQVDGCHLTYEGYIGLIKIITTNLH